MAATWTLGRCGPSARGDYIVDADTTQSGDLAVNGNEWIASGSNTVVFTFNGPGINSVSADLNVGGPGATGTYALGGGQANIQGTAYLGGSTIGAGGVGVLNVPGGSFTAGAIQIFNTSNAATLSGINLAGGTITTGSLALPDWSRLTFSSGTLNLTGGSGSAIGNLAVGTTGTATVNQTGGNYLIADTALPGRIYLGSASGSLGMWNHSAGALTASYLYFGYGTASTGVYTLSGSGSLSAPGGSENVGYYGNGTVDQSGGSNHSNLLYIGSQVGSVGTFNLSGGTVDGGFQEYVGFSGAASFNQTGGANTAYYLDVAANASATGTYTLSGNATLTIYSDQRIGGSGLGAFNQSGGTNATSTLYVGYGYGTGRGSYTLSGAAVFNAGKSEYIGYSDSGSFTQTGGQNRTVATNGAEAIGWSSGSSGLYDQSGGSNTTAYLYVGYEGAGTYNLSGSASLIVTSDEYVADTLTGNGVFNQSGGVNRTPSLTIGFFGHGAAYNLSGGLLTVTTPVYLGYDTRSGGSFTQTGGTHVAGGLYLSAFSGTGSGALPISTYDLSGGSVTLSGNVYLGGTTNGVGGVGILRISGGSFDAGTNTVQVFAATSGGVRSGVTLSGGTFTAGRFINNAAFSLSGGAASLGALSGSGTTTLTGTGAAATQLTVGSLAQSTLSIGNNSSVTLLPATPAVTNTAGTLTITGSGRLDLANHQLVTQTPAASVRSYLVSAYANNAWTGHGITSSTVAASNGGPVKKYALGYAAAGQPNVVPAIPANSVLVRPTLFGDANLDGKVDNADVSAVIAGGKYLDGTTNNSWAVGDWNYDGKVDNNDISNLIASGNYLSGETANGAAPAASRLTSRAAGVGKPASSTEAIFGNGVPQFIYNDFSGDVTFSPDGVGSAVQELHIRSASGLLNASALVDPNIGSNGLDVTTPYEIDLFRQGSRFGTLNQFGDGYDLGRILPPGYVGPKAWELLADLTVTYTANGGGTSNVPAELYAYVPEPSGLALLGVAAARWLTRRRHRPRR